MIQICGEPIALSLKLILETALKEKIFPDIWKTAMWFLFIKKTKKNLLKSYRPIGLLPIKQKYLKG